MTPLRLVLLGPPGSGKGTQGTALARHYGVPHLSSGELLRRQVADGTDLGRRVAGHLARGELVPDDLIVPVVCDAVAEAERRSGGYVLDGFPRTRAQARELGMAGDDPPDEVVVHLAAPDDLVRRRLAGRAGEGRVDDASRQVIERRLRSYHDETEPLLDLARSRGTLVTVDADRPPGAVTSDITAAVDGRRRPA